MSSSLDASLRIKSSIVLEDKDIKPIVETNLKTALKNYTGHIHGAFKIEQMDCFPFRYKFEFNYSELNMKPKRYMPVYTSQEIVDLFSECSNKPFFYNKVKKEALEQKHNVVKSFIIKPLSRKGVRKYEITLMDSENTVRCGIDSVNTLLFMYQVNTCRMLSNLSVLHTPFISN